MPPINLNILHIDSRRDDIRAALAELRRRLSPEGNVVSQAGRQRTLNVFGEPLSPLQVVQRICGDVKARGLAAVLDYSRRIDKAELPAEEIRVPAAELDRAHAAADPQLLAAVRRIRRRIEDFQTAILQHDVPLDMPNGYLKQRWRPLGRVGICVPGGAAAYPSTVLMTAVPAQVAGVAQLAVVAPPTPFGISTRPCWPPAASWTSPRSIASAAPRPWPPWPTASRASPAWTRSSGPATSSSPWPSDTSTATSTSIPSPAPAKWW